MPKVAISLPEFSAPTDRSDAGNETTAGTENRQNNSTAVDSYYVVALRWVGGVQNIEVRFRFVWLMRMARILYRRLTIGIAPSRLAYA